MRPIYQTRILPLRWFANICEIIASPHLVKVVYLDEDQNFGWRYRYHSKMWSIFFKPYRRWGTYYTFDEVIEGLKDDPVLDKLGSDYDEDGIPYWEKDIK